MKSLTIKIDPKILSLRWCYCGTSENAPTKNQTLIPSDVGATIILMSWKCRCRRNTISYGSGRFGVLISRRI